MPVAIPEPEPEPDRDSGSRPLAAQQRAEQPQHVEELVSSVAQSGYPEFYRSALPRLVAFLRWQGASLPDAADCAQEALTLCFRDWAEIGYPLSWCRRTAGRVYARRVATAREHLTDCPDRAGLPLLPPNTDLSAVEHRHILLAIIDLLPLRQRQVLAWTYDGASDVEIAAALQISQDDVRSHRRHARAALRDRRHELGVDL